jgi:hypothetical protein
MTDYSPKTAAAGPEQGTGGPSPSSAAADEHCSRGSEQNQAHPSRRTMTPVGWPNTRRCQNIPVLKIWNTFLPDRGGGIARKRVEPGTQPEPKIAGDIPFRLTGRVPRHVGISRGGGPL